MQILSAIQIRQWDAYTIEHENISSVDLMERAVSTCVDWLEQAHYLNRAFVLFCGKGNNGGDGLALARLLSDKRCEVAVYILESQHSGSEEFQVNLQRLQHTGARIAFLQPEDPPDPIPAGAVIIDALFGSGLNRAPDAATTRLIGHINGAQNERIAIDLPSGMFADKSSRQHSVVKATHTLTFQCHKLAFLMAENEPFLGDIHVLDIGLSPEFLSTIESGYELLEKEFIRSVYRPRHSASHKGTFGHALLVAGSHGKMGAAVLCSKACLRSGVGLLTGYIPACGHTIMQISVPEAMVMTSDSDRFIASIDIDLKKYTVIGLGPGLGTDEKTAGVLDHILQNAGKPLVIDADGLNLLATNPALMQKLIPGSILTPHPKEFDRLFGDSTNDFERMELARSKAGELGVIIVLKGHHTFIATPGGKYYFNSTGNAGMATGGSGDTLTGIITGLVAQAYSPELAALMGVYLHGLAGDLAASAKSQEAMIAGDITDFLGAAFLEIA